MVFLIDMGNTALSLAAWQEGGPVHTAQIPTSREWTKAEYTQRIGQAVAGWGKTEFEGCALSSVVPPLTTPVAAAMQAVCGHKPVVLGYEGLSFAVHTQDQVGADMLAGAEAVKAHYALPAVVADLGTATTICAQNKAGDVLGAAIAPGIVLGLNALVGRASHLNTVAFEIPGRVLGLTTAESLKSGVIYGAAGVLDSLFRRAAAEMDRAEGEPAFYVTGGLAGLVVPYCQAPVTAVPHLLLEGLYEYYLHNKES